MPKTETGTFNKSCGINASGLSGLGTVRYNLEAADLYELALGAGEAKLTANGALVAYTGQHTGRSPKDKFVVRDDATESHVWWDNNKSITRAQFVTVISVYLFPTLRRVKNPSCSRSSRIDKSVVRLSWHSSARYAPEKANCPAFSSSPR